MFLSTGVIGDAFSSVSRPAVPLPLPDISDPGGRPWSTSLCPLVKNNGGSTELSLLYPTTFPSHPSTATLSVLIAFNCRVGVGYRTLACGGRFQLLPPLSAFVPASRI